MNKSYHPTPSGMKAAQRAYDAQEHPDYYGPPRRRNRTITTRSGEEISEADVEPPHIDEEVDRETTPQTEDEN